VPGIRISSPLVAAEVVVILLVTNLLLGNLLKLITLPTNRLSFGLIGFGINVLVIGLTARWVDGFEVSNMLSLVFFAVALSVSSYVIDKKIL
jgi:putative membrane protein